MTPIRPDLEAGFRYFYYFLTERGYAVLTANRREIAEVIWRRNSPKGRFDDAMLDRAAEAFTNPEFVGSSRLSGLGLPPCLPHGCGA
jgi:hypothetical protein